MLDFLSIRFTPNPYHPLKSVNLPNYLGLAADFPLFLIRRTTCVAFSHHISSIYFFLLSLLIILGKIALGIPSNLRLINNQYNCTLSIFGFGIRGQPTNLPHCTGQRCVLPDQHPFHML